MMKSTVDKAPRRRRVGNFRLTLSAGVLLAVALAVFVLPPALAPPPAASRSGYVQHTDAMQPRAAEKAAAFITEDGRVLAGFASHLPLVLIDTDGRSIPVNQQFDLEKGYMVPIPGVEPFVAGEISVYDGGGYNRLADAPAFRTKVKIKRRGNSSQTFEKAQYKLNLLTADGEKNRLPLLGMDEEDEWVLNGNMLDRSLMRNYLPFILAAELSPVTPEVRYCEVLLRDGGEIRYEGVYLLMENVKQGPGRVALNTERPGSGEQSFLLRRDRYDTERPVLNTYATENELAYGYLAMLYPKNDNFNEDVRRYAEKVVSAAERVLYTDDINLFLTYPDHLDVDSFVDYYVLNEFFGNYDAGFNSTYLYKDLGGKLHIGPIWDYDSALDNYKPEPMDPEIIAFGKAPWFDRLTMHREFVERLIARCKELRRGPLAPRRIDAAVGEIARYLGPAQERDWLRWQSVAAGPMYALDDIVIPVTAAAADGPRRLRRQTAGYEQEILKLRYLLYAHGEAIVPALRHMLNDEKTPITTADDYKKNSLIVILFLLSFTAAVFIARRHGSA